MQSPSAVCAVHPQLGAVFTCERCGAFGCDDCRGPSLSLLCLACFQRLAPENAFTSGRLLRDSFCLMGRNLSGVGLFLSLSLSGMLLLMLLPNPAEYGGLVSLLFGGVVAWASAAFFTWTAAGLLRSGRSLSAALGWGLRRSPFLLLQGVLFVFLLRALAVIFRDVSSELPSGFAFIGIPLLILLILYLASCWFLAPTLAVLERIGPLEAFRRSATLTQGHRWTLLVVFALWALLHTVVALAGNGSLPLPPRWEESLRTALSVFLTIVDGLSLPFFGGMMVLAWMRLTGRVPPSS